MEKAHLKGGLVVLHPMPHRFQGISLFRGAAKQLQILAGENEAPWFVQGAL